MSEISINETEVYKEFDILLDGEVIGSAEIKYPDMTLNNFNILPQHQGKGYEQKAIKKFIDDFGITNLRLKQSIVITAKTKSIVIHRVRL